MKRVLAKVHSALRDGGQLLIIQPAIEDPDVVVEFDGVEVFRETKNEANFRFYLRATVEAIHQAAAAGQYDLLCEVILPEGDVYHCRDYDSVDAWEDDRGNFCEDVEAFSALAERIRAVVGAREARVLEYWKEYQVLLGKPANRPSA